jgi:WD40 repeat protein
MEKTYAYQAFISYRHVMPDMTIANELHRQLESYAIPSSLKKKLGMKKIGKVFRDHEELPTSVDLGKDIERALEESAWLIVVCTPKLLESKWCMKEIDAFIAMGRRNRILTLLVEGEPEDAFPPQLRYSLVDGIMTEIEPLAADVRGATLKEMISKMKVEKLRILAPILNVAFDDLKQRAREQRLRNIAKITLVTSLLLIAFSIYAINRNMVISKERDESYRNEMLLLLEKSTLATNQKDKLGAAVYALDALEISNLIENDQDEMIQNALEATMYATIGDQISIIKNNNMAMTNLKFSPNGERILATANANNAVIIDSVKGEMLFTVNNNLEPLGITNFSADSEYFLTVCHWENSVSIWNSANGSLVNSYKIENSESWLLGHAEFTSNPDEVLIKEEDRLILWNFSTDEILMVQEDLTKFITRYAEGVISSDRRFFALISDLDGAIRIWNLVDNKMQVLGSDDEVFYSIPRFNLDASLLAAGSGQVVYLWNIEEGRLQMEYTMNEGDTVTDLSFSPSSNQLLISNTTGIHVVDIESNATIWSLVDEANYQMFKGTYSPNGEYILVKHEWLHLFDAYDGTLLTDFGGIRGSDAIFHQNNGTILISMEDGAFGAFTTPKSASIQTWTSFSDPLYTISRFTELKRGETSLETQHSVALPFANTPPRMYSSPEGHHLALAHSDGFVEIWDVDVSSRPKYGIAEHQLLVTDLLFSGNLVATASYDGRVMLFDLDLGQIRAVIPVGSQVHRIEFSADNKKIMIYCSEIHTAFVYTTKNPVCLFELKGATAPMMDLGFTMDSTKAVLISSDGSAQVGTIYSQRDILLEAIQTRTGYRREQ